MKMSTKRRINTIVSEIILIFVSFIVMMPVILAITMSLQTPTEVFSFPPKLFPSSFYLGNFPKALKTVCDFVCNPVSAGGDGDDTPAVSHHEEVRMDKHLLGFNHSLHGKCHQHFPDASASPHDTQGSGRCCQNRRCRTDGLPVEDIDSPFFAHACGYVTCEFRLRLEHVPVATYSHDERRDENGTDRCEDAHRCGVSQQLGGYNGWYPDSTCSHSRAVLCRSKPVC